MPDLRESAEVVQGSMNFIQEFLQKKYAWGIVFFVIIIAGVITLLSMYMKSTAEFRLKSSSERQELIELNKEQIRLLNLRNEIH